MSVIIPVHNAADALRECLAALARSTHAPFECIVVDDGSVDDSAHIAEESSVRVLKTGKRRGPAAARNLGARYAGGEILVFLDADVRVHEDTLERIVQNFITDAKVDAIMGSYDDAPTAPGFCSQYRNLLHCFVHQTGRREASTFWTGCGAVRKRVFVMLGGFNERFTSPSMEDVEFGYRMATAGCRVVLNRAVLVRHLKRWTLAEMFKTDFIGRGVPWTRLILRYRRMPNDLNLRWAQRLSVVMAWGAVGLFTLAIANDLQARDALAVRAAAGAAVCLIALSLLNLPFYRFLFKERGLRFALAATPLHWCYHFLNGMSFMTGFAIHLCSLTQMFLTGRFRRVIDAETRLLNFETSLTRARNLEECWASIQTGSREVGFDGVNMSLAGMLFQDSSRPTSKTGWQLRFALSETDYVNFFRNPDADSGTDPLILGEFVRCLACGLRERLEDYQPGKIPLQPPVGLS